MNSFHLKVLSSDGCLFDDQVNHVKIPTITGPLGVLPNHAPVITLLENGVLVIQQNNDQHQIPVKNGVVDISQKYVNIIVSA